MHVYTFLNFIYAYISFKINSFKDIRFASMYVTSIINDINFVSVLHSIISINYLIRISKIPFHVFTMISYLISCYIKALK